MERDGPGETPPDHGRSGTGLSGSKLKNSDPTRVGPRGYDPHGSVRVSQGPVRMGHGRWSGSFFLISQKK
jgi:hypothetical protein